MHDWLKELVEEVHLAHHLKVKAIAEAGTASVHIHARDPQSGKPTADVEVFREILTHIKVRSDVIICITAGGGATLGISAQDRIRPVAVLKPELASYDVGSMLLTGEQLLKAYKDETTNWIEPKTC